jgi:DNA-binding beta-propeller fold protein YncE
MIHSKIRRLLGAALSMAVFAAAICVLGHSGLMVKARAQATWHAVEGWPKLPPGKTLGTVSGVAVDKNDTVYVFERNELGDMWMFDKAGYYKGEWAPSGKPGFVKMAHTIHIDPNGFFWITDRTGNQLKKFTPDGKQLLLTIGTGKAGDGQNEFNGPTGIQFFPNGDLMVSDGYWNSRVIWFDKNGKYRRSYGTSRPRQNMDGRGPGNFGLVHAAAQLTDGRILVSDRCDGPVGPEDETRRNPRCTDSRVQVLDRQGKFLEYWNQYHGPLCLLVVNDKLYLAEGNNILILDARTGKQLDSIPGASGAHQIAVDATGQNVYATFLGNGAGQRTGGKGSVKRFTRESM